MTAGLNQLGIRNVSEQLFTILLPGLNNVSVRIRYYSFYCWIIRQFYEGKQAVRDTDFNPFIRRAELLVALINATLSDSKGIPGINFATVKVEGGAESISLIEGADIERGKTTYWANHGGVLRQYYVASLEEIGLIGQNEKYPSIYNITKDDGYVNGLTLADEFAESIGDLWNLFLDIVARGVVTMEELEVMNDKFRMKYLSAGSRERTCLQRMLLQRDNPLGIGSAMYRRKTIRYILEYLSASECQLRATGFARYMYERYCDSSDLTAWGWYAYYLDNNWQYQFTQIFHEVLGRLRSDDKQWIKIDDLSEKMARKVVSDFNISSEMTVKEYIGMLDGNKSYTSTAEAVHNLLAYHRDNISGLSESEAHYRELGIHSENFCNFMRKVSESEDTPVYCFVKKLVEEIIYRHYRVSFRKMLQTQKATQKFAMENGCIRFIDGWDATNTSPRIDTMRNFLVDLQIIEPNEEIDVLTDLGIRLLNELRDGDTAA